MTRLTATRTFIDSSFFYDGFNDLQSSRGACGHGDLILQAKAKWVNSPTRRARSAFKANGPVLTRPGCETILKIASKHTLFRCTTTMPKERLNFKQTFV